MPLHTIIIINGAHRAGGRVVRQSPLTQAARVQPPDVALLSLIQATILSGSVKCVATSKQGVTAVDNF